jgi:hypothetical protein
MTIDEFIEEVKKLDKTKFVPRNEGYLRFYYKDILCMCPIIAVCFTKIGSSPPNYNYQKAAKNIGLDPTDTEDIVIAADYRYTISNRKYDGLREKLIEAAYFYSSAGVNHL